MLEAEPQDQKYSPILFMYTKTNFLFFFWNFQISSAASCHTTMPEIPSSFYAFIWSFHFTVGPSAWCYLNWLLWEELHTRLSRIRNCWRHCAGATGWSSQITVLQNCECNLPQKRTVIQCSLYFKTWPVGAMKMWTCFMGGLKRKVTQVHNVYFGDRLLGGLTVKVVLKWMVEK